MQKNLSVRLAKPSDGKFVTTQIRKLIQLAEGFNELPEVEGIDKCWDEIVSNPTRSQAFIAEADGVPCGAAVVSFNYALHLGGEYCYLQDLIVDDSIRASGAGSALLKKVEEFSKEKGMISVDLTQPPPGSNYDDIRSQFYEKRGYSQTGMGRSKHFVNNWRMK